MRADVQQDQRRSVGQGADPRAEDTHCLVDALETRSAVRSLKSDFGVGDGFTAADVFAGTGTRMTPLSGGMNWLLGLFGSIV